MNKDTKTIFERLIGAQIIKLNEKEIIVKAPNGETLSVNFYEDHGDCCGYTRITKELFFEPNDKDNPVITDVEWCKDENENRYRVRLTLFGVKKPLAEYEFECGSNSGWCYGAAITAMCSFEDSEIGICRW